MVSVYPSLFWLIVLLILNGTSGCVYFYLPVCSDHSLCDLQFLFLRMWVAASTQLLILYMMILNSFQPVSACSQHLFPGSSHLWHCSIPLQHVCGPVCICAPQIISSLTLRMWLSRMWGTVSSFMFHLNPPETHLILSSVWVPKVFLHPHSDNSNELFIRLWVSVPLYIHVSS